MILNGLGFANRPLSLTPQFFANKPLDLLLREGIDATMFNRFKLGRTLRKPLPMAATCCLRNWPVRSVLTKALICTSIISTRPALRSLASTS